MSGQESGSAHGTSKAADPFTKIRFHPHEGIMSFAPIRPGILKEIGSVVDGATAADGVTQ